MEFLEQFTLYDVSLIVLGLVIASLIWTFYYSLQQKKRINKLSESIKIYNESIDMHEEGVLVISNKDEIIFYNKEASRIFDYANNAMDIDYLRNRVTIKLDESNKPDNFLEIINSSKNIPSARIITANISIPVSVNVNKFHISDDGDRFCQAIVIQDITDKLRLQERIDNQGCHKDLLTDLPIKYHLSYDLVTVVLKSTDHRNDSALGMFGIKDIHSLRIVNGIEKIDLLVKAVSTSISDILLENETLYKLDDNSFAIIFENSSDKNGIRKRLNYIVVKLHDILASEGYKSDIIQGLYFVVDQSHIVEDMIDECFKVLYSDLGEKAPEAESIKMSLNGAVVSVANNLKKSDFEHAIENKDFFFFYQPIFDLIDNKFIGVEVLSRLNHKKYGFLVADDFLPKAIEYEMASEITGYLLDTVLSQKKLWSMEGDDDMNLTINLALSDLQSGVFAKILEQKLIKYKIDPATIIIDIPEIILSRDFDSIVKEFNKLHKMGVKLAIDHFGKEFINLKHIEQLPLYAIKIDKSIITNMVGDIHKMRLVSSIVSLGHRFGIKVGANHVATYKTKELLVELDCDFAQGYYFGKAVPIIELNDLMRSNSL